MNPFTVEGIRSKQDIRHDRDYYVISEWMTDERYRHNWVRDDLSDKCLACEKQFHMLLRRRHHCRSCGGIFCYECSGYSIVIPKFIESCPKPEYNPLDIKNYIPSFIKDKTLETLGYSTAEERVCFYCYRKIKSMNEISDWIRIFSHIILDLPSYSKMALVSKTWSRVSRFYLNNFRQIQFYLPDHSYTERERQLLWVNRQYICGHSKWLVPFVKSVSWRTIDVYDKKECIDILYATRKYPCSKVLCCGHCEPRMTSEEAIVCLHPYIEEKEIRRYIFESISRSPTEELLCYLPYMVYACRFYYNKMKNKCQISDYLIHLSTQNYTFLNYFYWELNLQMCDRPYKTMYHAIKLKLLDAIQNVENREILLNSEGFIKNISTIIVRPSRISSTKELLRDHLLFKNYFHAHPIALPLNPANLAIGIDLEGMRMKNSATRPIDIPFVCRGRSEKGGLTNPYPFHALFKTEDVRKDYLIMKIIWLMDFIIYRELNLELNLVKYAVLPVDESCGFVEMIPNAQTIYHIHEKLGFTIQNYIIEKNGDVPVEVLRDRFVKSCAGYCVISYLLGIGDRHLDNIMITEDGYLFHIDYSFILGYDPKIITKNAFGGSEIRLTTDMIDMMGGMESRHYKRFKEICNACYVCLRQHTNLFYTLLSMLSNYKPTIDGNERYTKSLVEKHIIDKFIPFETNYEARIHINTKLRHNSQQNFGTSLSDLFHYYKKESWVGRLF